MNQGIFPLTHHFSFPAYNRILINRECFIRHHQILINADYLTKALTYRTGADWGIETESMYGGRFKYHSVSLKTF